MNSADVHKRRKSDWGMEGRNESTARGIKSLTPGERKERFSRQVNGGDPEVQYGLDFTKELHGEKGLTEQRRISQSLDRWEVMG